MDKSLIGIDFYNPRDYSLSRHKKVDKGDIQAAFLLKPVSMSVLQTVCQSGQVMPRKSTYFYPKLPTGLLFYLWD